MSSSPPAVGLVWDLLKGQQFVEYTLKLQGKPPNLGEISAFLKLLLGAENSPEDLTRILAVYMAATNMEDFYLCVKREIHKLSEKRGKVPDSWVAQLVSENSNFSDFAVRTVTRKMTDSDFLEAVGIP